MDEKYYRELIDRVNQSEKGMWGGADEPNDGYEDFNQLWGLLSDEEANLSPKTYFEAIDLCINSFFGTIQDYTPIWQNIATHYAKALNSVDAKESYTQEFGNFLSQILSPISDMEIFYNLMHLAIEDGNLKMVTLLVNHSPIEIEGYDQLKDDYKNYPEWAAYIEGLTDISYDKLPNDPIFNETINGLYSKFGNLPNMEKLEDLYNKYC